MCAHELFYSAVKWLLTILLGQLLPGIGLAQPYQSVNYRWEHGFTASAGYAIQQDKDGYIWIGTENGLMRFNGHDFKTYTTRDGLSDNEVVGMKEDSRGRIWVIPFVNSVCFVYAGKIHNARNTSMLKDLHLSGVTNCILEDRYGTIWFYEGSFQLVGIDTAGHLKKYRLGKWSDPSCVWLDANGYLMLRVTDDPVGKIFRCNNTGFTAVAAPPSFFYHWTFRDKDLFYDFLNGRIFWHSVDSGAGRPVMIKMPSFTERSIPMRVGDELFLGTDKGAIVIDARTGKIKDRLLPDCKVGCVLRARDGALWLGTIGRGIFRLTKTPVQTVSTSARPTYIAAIKGTDSGMYCITDRSDLTIFRKLKTGAYKQEKALQIAGSENPYCPYTYLGVGGEGQIIVCGYGIRKINIHSREVLNLYNASTVKGVAPFGNDLIWMATINGAYLLDMKKCTFLDSFILDARTTAVAARKGVVYVSTLRGIYTRYPDGACRRMKGAWSASVGRVTALCAGKDTSLWVAGSQQLTLVQHDSVILRFDLGKGLPCNRISCMRMSDSLLWVGTDKGLFAVNAFPPYRIVRHITYASGLTSNQVNCIDLHKGRIWVGTINGVNYFDEADMVSSTTHADIIINNIRNGNKLLTVSEKPLQLENKPLTIEFDAIDFSGGARPVFEYRINEHGPWTQLEGNVIYFSTLPAGRFSVSIRAFAPNWSGSRLLRQEFYNPLPYYRTGWFTLSLGLLVLAAAGLLMWLIVKRIRNVYARKLAVQQNLLRLEQMALQGQMNPHFIFNCIAALRQYYNAGDRRQADNFVDAFSSLIRRTFEMGTETFVSLDRELEYLALYLKVEQARFDGSFQYNIEQRTQLPAADIPVPAMLLQPFVENAIRHGLRHLPSDNGLLHILVKQEAGYVHIEITDNGIGIRKSMEMKKQLAADHLSSSIVNNKRIAILNRLLAGKVELKIGDRPSGGTIVTLRYPTNINELIIL